MDRQSSDRLARFTDGPVMEEEIQECLARSLECIRSERQSLTALVSKAQILLDQVNERLIVLARSIQQEVSGCEDLSETSRQLLQLSTSEALQHLTVTRDSRGPVKQEQATQRSNTSLPVSREALSLLGMTVRQLKEETKDPQDSRTLAPLPGAVISHLSDQLHHEQERLTSLESDRKRRADAFEVLHNLSLLIHRCRCVLRKKMRKGVEELLGISMQIEGVAEGMKGESNQELKYWKARQEDIDDQLFRLEGKSRLFGLPSPGFQWISRRIRKLQEIESIQSRILAGLGVSLSLSLIFFLVSTTAITLLGTFSSINKTNERLERLRDYARLSGEVERLLNNNNQRLDIEADLDAIDEPIDRLVESIKSLQVAPPEPLENSEGGDAADKRQVLLAEQSQALENLNEQRNQYLNQRAVKDNDYTAIISRLTTLQKDIATNGPGSAQARQALVMNQSPGGSAAASPSSFGSELDTEVSSQTPSPGTANEAPPPIEAGDPWYVSLIDFVASPIQDQNFLKHSRRLALAAFAGALGSIMSILIRLDQFDEKSIKNPFMVGALKPFIGGVFGIVIFMILSTNVIDLMPANFRLHNSPANADTPLQGGTGARLTTQDPLGDLDSQELYKIFLVAFLAGFSERLASDTLRSVEKK